MDTQDALPGFIVIGCGYTGRRLVPALSAQGQVTAASGSSESAARLQRDGIGVLPWDLDREAGWPRKLGDPSGSTLLYLVPPPRKGRRDPRMTMLLDSLPSAPRRLVYISTVGVYGDTGGETVTETSAPQPATDRARRRLDAEDQVLRYCSARSCEWVILRVPAIYGPGRLPIERLRRGIPMLREEDAGPGNRIHVDDLVQACVAAATRPQAANRIYNVGDGDPISTTAFITLAARIAGLPLPPALPMAELRGQLPPMALSFMEESRLVDTTRMREELGVEPLHASAEAGIRASLPPG